MDTFIQKGKITNYPMSPDDQREVYIECQLRKPVTGAFSPQFFIT